MLINIFNIGILFIIWSVLMGGLNYQLTDLIVGVIVTILTYGFSKYLNILPRKMHFNFKAYGYFLWLLKEIYKSAFSVIKIIWSKNSCLDPVFEWIDASSLEEIGEVIYGNSITLTPGTVTLDINNNMLLVHALDKSAIEDLKKGKMKRRVKSIIS